MKPGASGARIAVESLVPLPGRRLRPTSTPAWLPSCCVSRAWLQDLPLPRLPCTRDGRRCRAWPPPKEIAHDDAISVALTEGDLVYASHLGCWRAGARQLRGHWRPSSLPARAYRSSVPHSFGYRTGCERLVIPDTRLAWFGITITDASALAPSWERSRAS